MSFISLLCFLLFLLLLLLFLFLLLLLLLLLLLGIFLPQVQQCMNRKNYSAQGAGVD